MFEETDTVAVPRFDHYTMYAFIKIFMVPHKYNFHMSKILAHNSEIHKKNYDKVEFFQECKAGSTSENQSIHSTKLTRQR